MSTEPKRVYRELRYDFTSAEIRELGIALAAAAQAVYDARIAKITAVAELNSGIKAAEQRVASLAMKVNQGFELRQIACIEILDSPRPGRKEVVRVDTQQGVGDEPMTDEERQDSLAFVAEEGVQ